MRTTTARRLVGPALIAVIALAGMAGCSDDGDDPSASTNTTTEAADGSSTSTTAATEDGSSTTEGGSTEPGDDPTTSTTEGGTIETPGSGGDPGTVTPDEEAADVEWTLNADQYRGQDGTKVAFACPPDGEIGTVWGTDTYTDDSSVCSAAVHAGLINPVEGGRVVVEIAPGEESYEGSEANAVTTQDYGSWAGSFTFPEA